MNQYSGLGPLQREKILLDTGVSMETIFQLPPLRGVGDDLPPLLFLHGSFHGAWCWAEHWLPYFSSKGYRSYAISYRGTSGTPAPGGAKSVKMEEHLRDLDSFIRRTFPTGPPPVIVSHSLGGLILMKYLESSTAAPLSGAAWLCSVPPSGNGPMTKRFLKDRPWTAVKIVLGFVLKLATRLRPLATDLFFSQEIQKELVQRYMTYFQEDCKVGLDLMDMAPKLPINCARESGQASWLEEAPPRFVLGAENDCIVDIEGLEELALFLGVNAELLRDAPHDVMLGPKWKAGAERLGRWLSGLEFSKS